MKLTREKCMRDKNRMKGLAFKSCEGEQENINEVNDCSNSLEQLIKEHFDNPPLKLEELEPDMWTWDDYNKDYIKIICFIETDDGTDVVAEHHYYGHKHYIHRVFEENRFYRKEVKE